MRHGAKADVPEVFQAGDHLVSIALEYAEAVAQHTGTGYPFRIFGQYVEDPRTTRTRRRPRTGRRLPACRC